MGRLPQSRWLRLAEGVFVTVVLVVLFSVLVGPGRVVAELRTADPETYALVLVVTVVWLLAWSETLLVLLMLRERGLDHWHFRVVFLAGMGVRGVVPGGSVSGAPIMGYVVATASEAEPEESVAMASVAEFLYWLGSMIVLGVGFVTLFLRDSPSERAFVLTVALAGVTALLAVLAVVGMRWPRTVAWLFHRLAGVGRVTVGRVSDRVRAELEPAAVEERIERFFAAFRRLAEHPHTVVLGIGAAVFGWVCLVLALHLTMLALGAEPVAFALLFVVPASGLGHALSVLPGGIGGIETTQVVLLVEVAGVALGTAGTAVLLYRVGTYWFRLVVGAMALFYLGVAGAILEGDLEAEVQ